MAQIEEGPVWYGWEVLILGWSGAFSSFPYFTIAWYANPLFVLTVILLVKDKPPVLFSALSGLLIALTAFFFKRVWNDKEPPEVIVTSYGAGFYLWLTSFVILAVAAWVVYRKESEFL